MRKLMITLMLLGLFGMVAPGFAQEEETGTIADILLASEEEENSQFNTLLAAIRAADASVLEALSNTEAEYTVFAPTDDAFAALQEEMTADAFNQVMENPEQVTNILLYHVVEGTLNSEALSELDGQTLTTLQGEVLEVRVEDDKIFVHDAEITTADVPASNGVVHVINAVLILPEDATTVTEEATEQATAEESAEVATTEPTEAATESATEQVTEVLTEVATEESAEVATTEPTESATEQVTEVSTEAATEVAQVATAEATVELTQTALEEGTAEVPAVPVEEDATAEAPVESAATEEAVGTAEAPLEGVATEEASTEGQASSTDATPVPELIKAGTVADVVLTQAASTDAPEFTTLLAAILASDPSVVQTLSDENANVTVFAPTDEAFVALIETLGSDQFMAIVGDKTQLTNLVLYHVVDGRRMSADLVGMDGQAVSTLLTGQSLQITTDDSGNVLVNGIAVVTTDIEASNGVIHVITGVLSPIGGGVQAEGETESTEGN